MGGWVGGWVGGWKDSDLDVVEKPTKGLHIEQGDDANQPEGSEEKACFCMEWVGGWAGGWVD